MAWIKTIEETEAHHFADDVESLTALAEGLK